ncbi:hypothetical protein LYNGBM3L_11870 [Moorena producens 3L]|uniref:Uncharacterized protein n=1 Tax=Moorena producens 3L TaxID=489825 RepID=F4XS54_9CYAN|nr:hypothetical protein LYNGBM3L_11870 [Moorena producens 3L]
MEKDYLNWSEAMFQCLELIPGVFLNFELIILNWSEASDHA